MQLEHYYISNAVTIIIINTSILTMMHCYDLK